MIISRTPLRVSFLGGGTDFPDFYNEHNGAVISSAINKYIYVVVKKRFDDKIVLHYTKTETVDKVDDIQHDIIRECLKMVGLDTGIEITTLADIPSEGTGLGSSSSLTVGLLHALYEYNGIEYDTNKLAEGACKVEIDILGTGIGKQDQYIASSGGLNLITFQKDRIDRFHFKRSIRRSLEAMCLLFYTGITRQADEILSKQKASIPDNTETLKNLLKVCLKGKSLLDKTDYSGFCELIGSSWELKKGLAEGITNETIDDMHMRAMAGGSIGCKVCGAGGGGFMLVCCKEEDKLYVRSALADYRELPIKFEAEGSKIILP